MQIHVVQKDVHQDTKGYITVVVQDIELIKKRLKAVEEALEGTKFRYTWEIPSAKHDEITVDLLINLQQVATSCHNAVL